jgi:hypothetical protein
VCINLRNGLLLDHHDAVRTFVDDAHRDLLQIADFIRRELREVCRASSANDTDDVPERADIGGAPAVVATTSSSSTRCVPLRIYREILWLGELLEYRY